MRRMLRVLTGLVVLALCYVSGSLGTPDSCEDQHDMCTELTRTHTCTPGLRAICHRSCSVCNIIGPPVLPRDCEDILLQNDSAPSGVYMIYRDNATKKLQVYCDMETDGGGWTVILRRFNGSVNFNRNWNSCKSLIGNVQSEYWLGLDAIHELTNQGDYSLLVDMEPYLIRLLAFYDRFQVADEAHRFQLHVTGYNNKTSNAGDSLALHNGQYFSTYDRDNDRSKSSCAVSYKGAFWYEGCHHANLLGPYRYTSGNKGMMCNGKKSDNMLWVTYLGYNYTLKSAAMKIRRRR